MIKTILGVLFTLLMLGFLAILVVLLAKNGFASKKGYVDSKNHKGVVPLLASGFAIFLVLDILVPGSFHVHEAGRLAKVVTYLTDGCAELEIVYEGYLLHEFLFRYHPADGR